MERAPHKIMLQDFDELYKHFFAPVGMALAALIFAFAPFLISLLGGEKFTKRSIIAQSIQAIWLVLANILCGLLSLGYCVEKFGTGRGVAVAIIVTMFGGIIAFGLFEVVFQQRRTIGRVITKKGLSVLTDESQRTDDEAN